MIAYRAMLDLPRELAQYVGRLLHAERRRRGTRKRSRALTCFYQAVFALRWFRDNRDITALARDHGISRATGYRYLDEVITVLAAQAPDLHEALQQAKDDGATHVILDGKLFEVTGSPNRPSASRANRSTPGTSVKPTNPAATSKPSPPRTAFRCGSPRSNRARPTTSRQPAPTCSPPCTGPPPS